MLKGIGIEDAAPVYEPLPGFERYVDPLACITQDKERVNKD
jgi:hypothetical protein